METEIEVNMPRTMKLLRTTPPTEPIDITAVRNWHMALSAYVEHHSEAESPDDSRAITTVNYRLGVQEMLARHMATGAVLLLLRKHNVNAARLNLELVVGKESEPWDVQDAARAYSREVREMRGEEPPPRIDPEVEHAVNRMGEAVTALSIILHQGKLGRGWLRSMKPHEPLIDTVERCERLTQDIANAIACITGDREVQDA